ncbi:hypothetical protein KC332_g15508 [Hortaea werneckii]|uniref:Uncharacterized protein n=1 Tax=Hortaea werneckii TaxID=91943 RepID=A0A3M7H7W9_HORWE|nr:hypothetical protein KC358_g15511 [Hortaea werneckii]KAI6802715.1 hypothetical protein KC350_g15394 [Hortaea werneckii]KAI6904183.1 hypothetical protein KC348_g15432 [Hortaea werneckii]KAI6929191.1 hypothetical protein KC341_g11040 [Hortaea werneckii]KAI6955554.1 hypothetical protein KC321_g15691 [Hortaea werneckii]
MRSISIAAFFTVFNTAVVGAQTTEWKWGKMVEGTPGPEVTPTSYENDDASVASASATVAARGLMEQVEMAWQKLTKGGEEAEEDNEGDEHELRMRDIPDDIYDDSDDLIESLDDE